MDNRKEQIEALETLSNFNKRIIKNIPILADELSDNRLEDTDKFCKSTIDAINWEVQVMNGTMELLNEGKQRIDKAEFNKKITCLAEAIQLDSDEKLAEAFRQLQSQFRILQNAIEEVCGYV